MKVNFDKIYKNLAPKALFLLGKKGRLLKLANKSLETLSQEGSFKVLGHQSILMVKLLLDWTQGRYKGVKKKNLVLIVVGILYLLNPVDLIPDSLLGVGFLDDVAVFFKILHKIEDELDRYEDWLKIERGTGK